MTFLLSRQREEQKGNRMIEASKQEILKTIPVNSCCSYSFLNSLFSNAKCDYHLHHLELSLETAVVDKVKEIINIMYPNIRVKFDDKLILTGDVEQLLLDSGIEVEDGVIIANGINQELLISDCCKISFLKGLYLIAGNFYYTKDNNEKSSGYSIEFLFKNYAMADDSKALLKYLGIKIGMSRRGNNIVIYIKNSDAIYNFFVKLGAVETAINIQNNLMIREIRNDTNRQGNCFDANLNKTINASREQVKAIDYIIKNYGLDYLEESLQEVALIRLANVDITLNEMMQLYSQPITRAGLKYKLDKIIKIYKSLTK